MKLLPATDYALYTGCIIPLRYPDIENSIRETMPLLGANVFDMVGAGCCPPGGAFGQLMKYLDLYKVQEIYL